MTAVFENWNRYYDPSTGRYLQPEPMLQDPKSVAAHAMAGAAMPTYSYAGNNPIQYSDPTGRDFILDDLAFVGLVATSAALATAVTNAFHNTRVDFGDDPFGNPAVGIASPVIGAIVATAAIAGAIAAGQDVSVDADDQTCDRPKKPSRSNCRRVATDFLSDCLRWGGDLRTCKQEAIIAFRECLRLRAP